MTDKRVGLAMLLSLSLIGCDAELPEIRPPGANAAVEKTQAQLPLMDRVVIFPAERASELVKQCSRRVPGPVQRTWLPEQADIARLEDALGRAFAQALEKARPSAANHPQVNEYYRQYGGIVVGGRRIVYVNAFQDMYVALGAKIGRRTDWRQVAINVCDGGTMFFGAEFDVDTGKIATLVFNGIG
jgi:hypothetical protein